MKFAIIVPAFDEERSIAIVVNDCSIDSTTTLF